MLWVGRGGRLGRLGGRLPRGRPGGGGCGSWGPLAGLRLAATPGGRPDLQGSGLDGPVLGGHPLGGPVLEGSALGGHPLQGSALGGHPLEGSALGGHPLEGSALGGHPLEGPALGGHPLEGSALGGHPLEGSALGGHPLEGSALGGHPLEGPALGGHPLEGPALGGHPLEGPVLGGHPLGGPGLGGHPPAGPPGGWYEALAASAPVHWAEQGLVAAQQASGLPWWATIVCATVALRGAVTLPLAAHQHYILAKVENLQPEIKNIAKYLNHEISLRAKRLGWSKRIARLTHMNNMRRLVSELYVRHNCHPFKATLLVWIQLPMWVVVSVALRNLSVGAVDSEGLPIREQLSTGGALWFPDLTVLDSTLILPVSLGILNLLIVEVFALQKLEMSRFQKYLTHFIRGVSVLMIPIAATVPSSIALYWLCSSCLGLSQNLLLRSPRFRRLCRIPPARSDSDTPYTDLRAAFYAKYLPGKRSGRREPGSGGPAPGRSE